MKNVFPPEWRAQSRRKRKFYATYMRWLERIGFVVVLTVLAAFVVAFNYRVDDLVTADGVAIQPFATPVEAGRTMQVVEVLAEDFAAVEKGRRLFKVAGPGDAFVVAPASGVFRYHPDSEGGAFYIGRTFAKGEALARIVDYNDLRVAASLTGQTVPKAKVGQVARITAIAFEPEAGTLFRGFGDGRPLLSGRILGDEVKQIVEQGVVGKTLALRDDVPLKVTSVQGVRIDAAALQTPGGDPSQAFPLDPPAAFTLEARVIEGKPVATAQVAVLPSDLTRQTTQAIERRLGGVQVRQLDGATTTVKGLSDVRLVVDVKAEELDGQAEKALQGAVVKRSFDAVLQVVDPPPALVEAVRQADGRGKPATCRVELRTGTRPIAFLLLKKS